MNLAAIVLAAGSGTRFGGNKLSAQFLGERLITHAIRAATAAPVTRVVVVCPPMLSIGHWASVETIRITSSELSQSLKTGIAAVAGADGAFIFLGDMPLIPSQLAGQLAVRIGTSYAAIPRHSGKHGHPVLLSARAFGEIAHLSGDEGAGHLLKARNDIAFVDCDDEGVRLDVDRVDDLARLEKLRGS